MGEEVAEVERPKEGLEVKEGLEAKGGGGALEELEWMLEVSEPEVARLRMKTAVTARAQIRKILSDTIAHSPVEPKRFTIAIFSICLVVV